MAERPLSERQLLSLREVGRDFVSHATKASMPSLVKRGLVIDHGRYYESRGHGRRYEISEAGRAVVTANPTRSLL